MSIEKVGVVGAGQMGGGIAQVAAGAGLSVVVFDASAEQVDKCKATHQKLLARAVEKGRMEQQDADAALGRITYATEMKGLADRQLVIEAVVESEQVKRDIFAKL